MSIVKFIEEMKKTFILHAVAAHFSNGLIPVAVLYLLLALPSSDVFFEHTVVHLLVIVLMAIPISFLSGIREWKTKYKGAKAPVFTKKIRLSVVLFALCVTAVSIRISVPGVMNGSGILFWTYTASLFVMLPVVVLLGHYGGKLSSGQRQEKFR
jgi:phosphatidylserine synthase